MAFLETNDFCPLQEYFNYRENRIVESGLEPDHLYTYMMRLRGNEGLAACQTVRVDRFVRHSGFVAIKFLFLDEDLLTDHQDVEYMDNGLIETKHGKFVSEDTGAEFLLAEAYLREYDDGQYDELLRQSNSLALSGTARHE